MIEPPSTNPAAGMPAAYDPAPIAVFVRDALDSYLRQRAPDQRLAIWKAIALGYGGAFADLAGEDAQTSPGAGKPSPPPEQE